MKKLQRASPWRRLALELATDFLNSLPGILPWLIVNRGEALFDNDPLAI